MNALQTAVGIDIEKLTYPESDYTKASECKQECEELAC